MNVEDLMSSISGVYNLPNSLKLEQKEIIQCILTMKSNVVAVLPTGYGKSIIYTLPPLLLDEVRT